MRHDLAGLQCEKPGEANMNIQNANKLLLSASASILALAGAHGARAQQAVPAGQVEEVVVTGSRLQTGFSAPTPVSVIGSALLEARGKPTIGETLTELPAFKQGGGVGNAYGNQNVGQSLLDLRGLGATRTLVLIDGYRRVATQANGTLDTNTIPSLLVDRTEVVTGGASAAYGSDAVAGVVNFVMNRRLEGTKATVQAGMTDEKDAKELLLGFAHGLALSGGKGHFIIGGEWSRGDGSGTMMSRDWGRKLPGLVALPATRAAGLPAFLITNDAQSTIPPGSLITSCLQGGVLRSGTACAVGGLTFDNSGNPVSFQFGTPVGSSTMVGGGNPGMIYTTKDILLRGGFDRKAAMASINYEFSLN